MTSFIEVVLPLPLDKTFIYSVPENLIPAIEPGKRVLVSFRQRIMTGLVFQIKEGSPEREFQIKPVLAILDDEPLVTPAFFKLLQELSLATFVPFGELLKTALPPTFFVEEKGKVQLITRPDKGEIKKHFGKKSRQVEKILDLLSSKRAFTWRYLQSKASFSGLASILRRLEELGWVKKERKIEIKKKRASLIQPELVQLRLDFLPSKEFELPLATVEKSLEKKEFKTFLLFGPKARREDFFLLLLRKWGANLQKVLILVPEIAEVSSFLEKITSLVGSERVALLHGELSSRKREAVWLKIWRGEADLVIGPRSAVFAPMPEIRLIYVTEEADESYLHPSPFYDAREVAKLRAKQAGAVILFGSSSPSLSLFAKARKEGFLIDLDHCLGKIRVITFPATGKAILSPDLQKLISEHLNSGEKVALLVNRRGYASLLRCLRCGYVAHCPKCRRPLTLYSRKEKLICPQCGSSQSRWPRCPECQSSSFITKGYGLEAVDEEVRRLWPEIKVRAIEAETLRGKGRLIRFLKEVEKDKPEVIVCTQFLLPHLDWQKISLAIILNPEIMLAYPDFRSGERVFSLIRRLQEKMTSDGHGELIIQTAISDNYVIRALAEGDYYAFANVELRYRRYLGLPPWKCLARVILTGRNLRALARQAREIKARLAAFSDIEEILGPSVLPLSKGKHQIQIWLKSEEKEKILRSLSFVLKGINCFSHFEIMD